jgi:anaerobic magnesium-protoporphyrin IX monomethyl ester cyclase
MKSKKILLVRVPEIEYGSKNVDLRSASVSGLTVPLGISYLASVVRKDGKHDAQILDLYAEYYKEFISNARTNPDEVLKISKKALVDAISGYKPDILGFSALFLFQHDLVKDLVSIVKENFPSIRIYLGGYSTIVAQLVLNDIPSLDILFIGESENSIIQVLDAESENRKFHGIGGVAFRDDGHIVVNQDLNLANNLNDLPYPSFDMLPLKKYKSIFNRNEFPIMTSRSCPFSCNFCSSYLYAGRGHRKRGVGNLIGEIEELHKKYDIDFLWIRDDNFTVNKEHSKNLLKEMIKRKLSVPWCDSSAFHVNSIDEEFLDLCKASGCSELIFAVESGSERVLKEVMNKDVQLEHVKKMAKYCRDIGLPVQAYFVIGNPGETKDEINKTIDFAKEIQVDHCTFSIATPFPGTQYYDIAVKKGYLFHKADYILGMKYMEANMGTEDFSAQDLKDMQYDANIRVNFLENRLISGDLESVRKALKKFTGTFNQYNFHAIARLLQGYLHIKLGDIAVGEKIFENVSEMLKKSDIGKAYLKYIQWDTLPTDAYRAWLARKKG